MRPGSFTAAWASCIHMHMFLIRDIDIPKNILEKFSRLLALEIKLHVICKNLTLILLMNNLLFFTHMEK
jgi:hypothetical protein